MKTNYEFRYASNPQDVKTYDTERLRQDFMMGDLFMADEVNMVYSMYDRYIIGGALPVNEELTLETIAPLKSTHFLSRREVVIFNVGGVGSVVVDGVTFELAYKEALYIGMGDREVVMKSTNSATPSKFYFNSTPAHCNYPDRKITKGDAVVSVMGSLEQSNHRAINKMAVNQVIDSCQIQMGMTELREGSVWNTMPAHTHSRRMEAYFYFELPEDQAICHFMGEPTQTRHIWMGNEQAVVSPEWSIHSAAGTSNYTFIWGMGGENIDYSDQDFYKITELR